MCRLYMPTRWKERMMKRNAKRDNGDVFFCAILKHYDAVTQDFDVEALNAEIAQIETDQSPEYTKRIRHLLSKHKKICNPLDEVPISRPGLDHAIDLDPDFKYQSPKIYKLSKPELEELKRQLEVFLAKGWIKESFSPFAAPVLFARKANGGLRLCIDYRNLNKYTKEVNYPLPHIDVLLDTIAGAKVYTALDLAQGYHQLRIKRG